MAPIQPSPPPLTTAKPTPSSPFTYPKSYTFPPFFTLQPNLQTRLSQLRKWSRLIQRYCRHHRIFKLSLLAALDTPLFRNAELKKRLGLGDAVEVVDWMTRDEGGRRAEWLGEGMGGVEGKKERGGGGTAWVYWKRPEEWAEVIAGWVEDTGQKNTVLTLYELVNGEMTVGQGVSWLPLHSLRGWGFEMLTECYRFPWHGRRAVS